MSVGKASHSAFLDRYYSLRKMWFKYMNRREKSEYEENEVVPPLTRDQIIKQFGKMGVQVPMTPDQEPTPLED